MSRPHIVQRVVSVADLAQVQKLTEALESLTRTNGDIACAEADYREDNTRYTLPATSEQSLEEALQELQRLIDPLSLQSSDMFPCYRETVATKSTSIALAKSPNKHTRIYMTASPTDQATSTSIEDKALNEAAQDPKSIAEWLESEYGYSKADARKVWAFGPDKIGANILKDDTRCVQYLNEIKTAAISGFRWATSSGPLMGEPMRSISFTIEDVTMLGGAIKRGAGQIIPAVRRVVIASMLLGKPAVMEPIYLVEIYVSEKWKEVVLMVCKEREGTMMSDEQDADSGMSVVKFHTPVRYSFGLAAEMQEKTKGQATVHLVFDHWSRIEGMGDAMDSQSRLYKEIIAPIRELKGKYCGEWRIEVRTHSCAHADKLASGLKEGVPDVSEFLDKL